METTTISVEHRNSTPETPHPTAYHSQEDVTCVIKPLAYEDGMECTGNSIEELKDQLISRTKGMYDDDLFDEAVLVCEEDGHELLQMEELREHLEKGHDVFYLVGPNSSGEEFARNLDLVVRLYKELTKEADVVDMGKIEGDMYKWAFDRREDLKAIAYSGLGLLVTRLEKPEDDVMYLMRKASNILAVTFPAFDGTNCV